MVNDKIINIAAPKWFCIVLRKAALSENITMCELVRRRLESVYVMYNLIRDDIPGKFYAMPCGVHNDIISCRVPTHIYNFVERVYTDFNKFYGSKSDFILSVLLTYIIDVDIDRDFITIIKHFQNTNDLNTSD